MELKVLGANQTMVRHSNGAEAYFSYDTMVAAKVHGDKYRTDEFYSRTTSKHLTQMGFPKGTQEVSPEVLESLL